MVYVMSDLHGQLGAYLKMLDIISFSPDDTLYVVGDAIDRGKHGIKILQHIMGRDNIVFIRGNHEQQMLEARTDSEPQSHWRRSLGGNPTRNALLYKLTAAERNSIYKYVEASPLELHIEVEGRGRFHLVHGRPAQEDKEKLWGRFENDTGFKGLAMFNFDEERVICGHTPTNEYQRGEPMSIFFGSGFTDIDCGCAYRQYPGRLGCLRLNDMREFYCDIPTAIPKEDTD